MTVSLKCCVITVCVKTWPKVPDHLAELAEALQSRVVWFDGEGLELAADSQLQRDETVKKYKAFEDVTMLASAVEKFERLGNTSSERLNAAGSLVQILEVIRTRCEFPESGECPVHVDEVGMDAGHLRRLIEKASGLIENYRELHISAGMDPLTKSRRELEEVAHGASEGKSWKEGAVAAIDKFDDLTTAVDGTLRKVEKNKFVKHIKTVFKVLLLTGG